MAEICAWACGIVAIPHLSVTEMHHDIILVNGLHTKKLCGIENLRAYECSKDSSKGQKSFHNRVVIGIYRISSSIFFGISVFFMIPAKASAPAPYAKTGTTVPVWPCVLKFSLGLPCS